MKKTNIRKSLVLFTAAAGLSLLAGCVASSTSDDNSSLAARGAGAASQGGGVEKVTICHYPPGNPANMHTITVGSPAVKAHLAHGDKLGACACECGGDDTVGTGGDNHPGSDGDNHPGTDTASSTGTN